MNNGYIALLDSGIGGFSCLIEIVKRFPEERFLYLGDGKNAPYGNKSVNELYRLTTKNLAEILRHGVKAVILACNTLSATLLPVIKKDCPVPILGVYPPVKARNGKTFLFATPLTCARYRGDNGVSLFPLTNLASEIEQNKFDLQKVDIKPHLAGYFAGDNFSAPDTVILGCTHYFFVKNQFINHFCPQKTISGEEYLADRLYKVLNSNDLLQNRECFTVDFIGDNAEENFKFYSSVVKNIIFN